MTDYQFRMRANGETVDADGIVTDAEGREWGDVDALRKRANRLEAEAAASTERDIFKPAPEPVVSSEPTFEGGTLDALAEGIWAKRNEA